MDPGAAAEACPNLSALDCLAIKESSGRVIGKAPLAPRPDWLPTTGPGQRNVDPLRWSLTVQQWILFVHACVNTDTWKALVKAKGEYAITMYDLNYHFVESWTAGTGCSVALLMNATEQLPAEGMLSHAWRGSVVETYNCLQNMVNHYGVPPTARFFFCAFSVYQPNDGAEGGLSISEQLELKPFAKIIESKPAHGMFVVHTTVYEVYSRLWVVHEADVAIDAEVELHGLFDMYRWTVKKFEEVAAVATREGVCRDEGDRAMIDGLICERGGYDRLDHVITNFRAKMLDELKSLLQTEIDCPDLGLYVQSEQRTAFDWTCEFINCPQGEMYPGANTAIGGGWAYEREWSFRLLGVEVQAMPLGRQSYPFPELEPGWHETWQEKCRLDFEAEQAFMESLS